MKIFVVAGLGYGDEGKGTATHFLCGKYKAHTVVRTGGPQAFHRVVTAHGSEHVHSQFGSGTLLGSSTHLSRAMVINPDGILNEGEILMYEHGIRNIFDLLTIHESALVITPFHGAANRLRELARGVNRHGTVGVGVGETVLDAETLPDDLIIRAKDLGNPNLANKLEAIRVRKRYDLREIIEKIDEFPEGIRDGARKDGVLLSGTHGVSWTVRRFNKLAALTKIVDTNYVAEKILHRSGAVIFEPSQGVLLDRWYGFHPYTTKVRTMPDAAFSIIDECGSGDNEIKCLGVFRAYHTHHGAGPFVTECPELTNQLPDKYNGEHEWQGKFRVGHLDMLAAKYAIEACEGSRTLDGLMITCMDRVQGLGSWKICETYTGPKESDFFSFNEDGSITGIKVRHGMGTEQLKRQEKLGNLLLQCKANLTEYGLQETDQRKWIAHCADIVKERLGIPVVVVSVGPTEQNKIVVR
ncbi:MAG: adenylosuccinate synthetase [Candidatus Sungbacteria bacterium]|nr:adenylosuccinate synthetase [Candidatus Sungbacteria bacterium]